MFQGLVLRTRSIELVLVGPIEPGGQWIASDIHTLGIENVSGLASVPMHLELRRRSRRPTFGNPQARQPRNLSPRPGIPTRFSRHGESGLGIRAATMPACRAAPRATTSLTASELSGALPVSSCEHLPGHRHVRRAADQQHAIDLVPGQPGLAQHLLRRQPRARSAGRASASRTRRASAAPSAPCRRACR